MKSKILKMIVKYFNIKGFVSEIVTEVVDEALEKVVQDSANPFDNVAKAALWPEIEKKAKEIIEEKLDLEKIFKLDEA